MKKLILIILFICISNNIYALTRPGVGPFGMGMLFSADNEISFDMDYDFFYLSFEDNKAGTGLGISWVPLNFRYYFDSIAYSYFNLQVYWNILALFPNKNKFYDEDEDYMIAGPFAKINYAPNFDFNKYILSYGIKFDRTVEHFFRFNIEGGCRLIDNKNYFYFSVGIDALYTLLGLAFFSFFY